MVSDYDTIISSRGWQDLADIYHDLDTDDEARGSRRENKLNVLTPSAYIVAFKQLACHYCLSDVCMRDLL
jgi:hypothetical protein